MTEPAFDRATLDLLDAARVVEVETRRSSLAPVHRTITWIVVDRSSRVLVRAVRGARGRWYRELLANPWGAIHAGGRRIPVEAERAGDEERIEACSDALRNKYRSSGASLASMLRDEVLEATLELRPAGRPEG
jgi:hypothetical protein